MLSFFKDLSLSTTKDDDTTILYSSYLGKKGELNKTAKIRYFILNNKNEIHYYVSPITPLSNSYINYLPGFGDSLGIINLKDVINVYNIPNEFSFKLVTLTRTWHLIATSLKEKDEWLKHLSFIPPFTILHCGWISKQGDFIKNWKPRYMLLCPTFIFYFVDKQSSHKFVANATSGKDLEGLWQGYIPLDENVKLREIGLFENNEVVFALDVKSYKGGSDRTFCIALPDTNSARSWMEDISTVLEVQKKRTPFNSPRVVRAF